jgi:hypothetical protein
MVPGKPEALTIPFPHLPYHKGGGASRVVSLSQVVSRTCRIINRVSVDQVGAAG